MEPEIHRISVQQFHHLDPELPIEEFIGQAVGAASMCWQRPEGAGEFDSGRAARIVEEIMSKLSDVLR